MASDLQESLSSPLMPQAVHCTRNLKYLTWTQSATKLMTRNYNNKESSSAQRQPNSLKDNPLVQKQPEEMLQSSSADQPLGRTKRKAADQPQRPGQAASKRVSEQAPSSSKKHKAEAGQASQREKDGKPTGRDHKAGERDRGARDKDDEAKGRDPRARGGKDSRAREREGRDGRPRERDSMAGSKDSRARKDDREGERGSSRRESREDRLKSDSKSTTLTSRTEKTASQPKPSSRNLPRPEKRDEPQTKPSAKQSTGKAGRELEKSSRMPDKHEDLKKWQKERQPSRMDKQSDDVKSRRLKDKKETVAELMPPQVEETRQPVNRAEAAEEGRDSFHDKEAIRSHEGIEPLAATYLKCLASQPPEVQQESKQPPSNEVASIDDYNATCSQWGEFLIV